MVTKKMKNRIVAFAVTFVALLAASLVLQPAASQTQPAVPEFSLKLVNRSYETETSTSENPYTGETVTNPSYHVENLTIDVTIKHQPFTSYVVDGNNTSLFFAVRAKGESDQWQEGVYANVIDKYEIRQSDSGDTVVTLVLEPTIYNLRYHPIDVQVKAVIGYSYFVWSMGGGLMPLGQQFVVVSSSPWSSAQSIVLDEIIAAQQARINQTATATSNPTETPTQPVQQTEQAPQSLLTGTSDLDWEKTVIAVMAAAIAALAAGFVLVWRRMKQNTGVPPPPSACTSA